jgi:DNA-directed RNA polymerase specialized sigma24 family protein
MEPEDIGHLSAIETQWTLMFRAHQAEADAATLARHELLLRYYGAVQSYVAGIARDRAVAEELAQDFAVRFLRGDFKSVDPERGRFRDFLKAALRHLVTDHWRKKGKQFAVRNSDRAEPAAVGFDVAADLDQPFLEGWRAELLARTWEALAEVQQTTGQPYHTVLRFKSDRPEARAAELAAELGAKLGKSFTEDGLYQLLHRARRRFAELLVEEVGRSLQTSAPDAVTEELIELGLLKYCRSAVERRDRPS